MVDDLDKSPPSDADDEIRPVLPALMRVIDRFSRAISRRSDMGPWLTSWLGLAGALKELAMTLGAVGWRIGQSALDAPRQRHLSDQDIAAIQARFGRLVDAFPEISVIFFGLDKLDTVVDEALEEDQTRQAIAELVETVQARMEPFVSKAVGWMIGLDDAAIAPDRIQAFVVGLESLLQEVLDRWGYDTGFDGLVPGAKRSTDSDPDPEPRDDDDDPRQASDDKAG